MAQARAIVLILVGLALSGCLQGGDDGTLTNSADARGQPNSIGAEPKSVDSDHAPGLPLGGPSNVTAGEPDSRPPEDTLAISGDTVIDYEGEFRVTIVANNEQEVTVHFDDNLIHTGIGSTEQTIQASAGFHSLLVETATLNISKVLVKQGEAIEFDEPGPSHTIRPGRAHSPCTVNFLFHEYHLDYFIGTAAHCVDTLVPENERETIICAGLTREISPLGSLDNIRETEEAVRLEYSSWNTMHDVGETERVNCASNDFALLRIEREDWPKMHPATEHQGGPRCLHEWGTATQRDTVWGYGNSSLWFNTDLAKPKQGIWIGEDGSGWQHRVYFAAPGIPGDSGSPMLSHDGCAMGVASTIMYAPYSGSNDYTDVGEAIQYANEKAGRHFELVTWDEWHPSRT